MPPNCRVVDVSACSNAEKICSRFSSGIPTPVSRTVKCSVICESRSSSRRTSTITSPSISELDGIADKVDEHLPQADGIAAKPAGHIGVQVPGQFEVPSHEREDQAI